MVSSSNLLLAISTFSGIASAFWRLPCHERVGLARMDPIMNPGQVSGHVHALHGGGSMLSLSVAVIDVHITYFPSPRLWLQHYLLRSSRINVHVMRNHAR